MYLSLEGLLLIPGTSRTSEKSIRNLRSRDVILKRDRQRECSQTIKLLTSNVHCQCYEKILLQKYEVYNSSIIYVVIEEKEVR